MVQIATKKCIENNCKITHTCTGEVDCKYNVGEESCIYRSDTECKSATANADAIIIDLNIINATPIKDYKC